MTDRAARTIPAAAPGRLAAVQALLNTLHVEKGIDALADAAGAGAWLAECGLGVSVDRLIRRDLERLAGLRGVLRGLCGDGPSDPDRFAEVAGTTALKPRLDAAGRVELVPAGRGVDAVVGAVVGIVLDAQRDGIWDRLKICRNDRCRWAFYDLSRSRTGTWCAMGICGNRTKVAAYRRRHTVRQTVSRRVCISR